MQPVLRIEHLAKSYRIQRCCPRSGYRMLREALSELALHPLRSLRPRTAGGPTQEFWALENVNLQVHAGEVVGLVGQNGAGKSTLLKIISRITAPTRGRVELRGRVGSLLEVGTGFHPELTGRENIFLNGSILGMSRSEIARQFDAIVDFSGVQTFLDTPVKRYSSGMRVRLAFAVAAHLDPEIMVVDEVLAVGDAAFQSKCLAKMGDVAGSGRTVLFVSHNLPAVQNLCSRAVLLDRGAVLLDDAPAAVVDAYLKRFSAASGRADLADPAIQRSGNGAARLLSAELYTLGGEPTTLLPMGHGFRLRLRIWPREYVSAAVVSAVVTGSHGTEVCRLDSRETAGFEVDLTAGQCTVVECLVPQMNLMPGRYRLDLAVTRSCGKKRETLDAVPQAVGFEITAEDVYGTGQLPGRSTLVFLQARWHEESGVEPEKAETETASGGAAEHQCTCVGEPCVVGS